MGVGQHQRATGELLDLGVDETQLAALAAGESPALAREILTDDERRVERVLLELRIADGLPVDVLTPSERERVLAVVASGLADVADGRLRLTREGRLLADGVVRDLLD